LYTRWLISTLLGKYPAIKRCEEFKKTLC
jgi:hypothetical protein